jgi:hypothetical protein
MSHSFMHSTWPTHLFLPAKISTFLSSVRVFRFGMSFGVECSMLQAFRRDLLPPSSGCMLGMCFEQWHTKCIIWRQGVGKHVLVITKLHVDRVDFGNEKSFSTPWLSFLFFLPPLFIFFLSSFLFVSYFFLHQAVTIRKSHTEPKYCISFRERIS